jgi:hypothetical protein
MHQDYFSPLGSWSVKVAPDCIWLDSVFKQLPQSSNIFEGADMVSTEHLLVVAKIITLHIVCQCRSLSGGRAVEILTILKRLSTRPIFPNRIALPRPKPLFVLPVRCPRVLASTAHLDLSICH